MKLTIDKVRAARHAIDNPDDACAYDAETLRALCDEWTAAQAADDDVAHDFCDDGPARELLDQIAESRRLALAAARAAGAAEERARIVAMMRAEAAMWTDFWNRTGGQAELTVTDALDDMADRIERGEA